MLQGTNLTVPLIEVIPISILSKLKNIASTIINDPEQPSDAKMAAAELLVEVETELIFRPHRFE